MPHMHDQGGRGMEPVQCAANTLGDWKRLRLLLLCLVFCRGLVLMTLLPPFEAWDEYQHVGYVLHVAQTGLAAKVGETNVPPSLIAALAQFPQSRCGVLPRSELGAAAYAAYWEQREQAATRAPGPARLYPDVPLYEAQHGSLYYRLAAPIFTMAGGVGDLKRSVAALRLVNLLLTMAAIGIALGAMARLMRDPRHTALVGLLLASHPLFLTNCIRVANDALAVFLATCVIALGLGLDGRRLVRTCAVLGLVAGCAVRAKAVNYGLLPLVLFFWGWVVLRDKVRAGRAGLALLLLGVGALVVTYTELHSNLARFGVLTTMQEALVNRRSGR